jgi:hypothetical protein
MARWYLWVATLAVPACAQTDGGRIGDSCADHGDCVTGAQCFSSTCTPLCQNHEDCGQGYVCSADGLCERVTSQIGDDCERETDCGPGQICALDGADGDGDGHLSATCQSESGGGLVRGLCESDGDCKSRLCALGRCTEVCGRDLDCHEGQACVDIPRRVGDATPTFSGCLPARGRLELPVTVDGTTATVAVAVPGHAQSFAVVTHAFDRAQNVGVARVVDPNGALLYTLPASDDEYYANPIRYRPEPLVSTMLVPNTPDVALRVGFYDIDVGSFFADGAAGTVVPQVTVVYELGPAGTTLDLNFHFLGLADHPCKSTLGDAFGADAAATSPTFQNEYLGELQDLLGQAGVSLGTVTYHDLLDQPGFDGLVADQVGALLALSPPAPGVHVFVVRTIDPPGVQALAGGTPGPPGVSGSPASGVVIAADSLCYQSWQGLARTTAHVLARYLGLFRNVEPPDNLRADPIEDTPATADNLLFFSERGGTTLTLGQADVLIRSAVTR